MKYDKILNSKKITLAGKVLKNKSPMGCLPQFVYNPCPFIDVNVYVYETFASIICTNNIKDCEISEDGYCGWERGSYEIDMKKIEENFLGVLQRLQKTLSDDIEHFHATEQLMKNAIGEIEKVLKTSPPKL